MTKTIWTKKLACLSAVALAWACSDDDPSVLPTDDAAIDAGLDDTGTDDAGMRDADDTEDADRDTGNEDTGQDGGDTGDGGDDSILVTAYQLSDDANAMHPEVGTEVRLEGLVLTAIGSATGSNPHAFAQDQAGGAYSGLYLDIDDEDVAALGSVIPGTTLIDVKGTYEETFDELVSVSVTSWSVAGQASTPVEPLVVTTAELADPETAEAHEGVLVRVEDAFVTAENADYDDDQGRDFGEFELDGLVRVDDLLYAPADNVLETDCDRFAYVQGPLNFSFGNHKIVPRDAADLSLAASIDPVSAPRVTAGDDLAQLALCVYDGASVLFDNAAGASDAVLQSVDPNTGEALADPIFLASAEAGMTASAGPLAPGTYAVGSGEANSPFGYIVVLREVDTSAPPLAPGDLIVTEFMANPKEASDNDGEYIEIYNTTGAPIDLMGVQLEDRSGASNRGNFTVTTPYSLPAGAYAVFARSDVTTDNGGITPTFVMGGALVLGNGGDFIEILDATGTLIDRVDWGGDSTADDPLQVPNGASLQLKPTSLSATANDDPMNWCTATTAWPGSAGDFGTPGAANVCP